MAEIDAHPREVIAVRLRHARIHAVDCAGCETRAGMVDRTSEIDIRTPLTNRPNDPPARQESRERPHRPPSCAVLRPASE